MLLPRHTCLSALSSYLLNLTCQFSSNTIPHASHKVLFFGTDHYSIFALRHLFLQRSLNPNLISHLGICSKFSGQMCELAKFAKSSANSGESFVDFTTNLTVSEYDIGVIASFGSLIHSQLISSFPYGIVCIHPSLLPRWRGAAPLMRTILNNDQETGVTLIRILPEKFDIGPSISHERFPVPENITSRQLGKVLMERGVELFISCLKNLDKSFELAVSQNNSQASYAKKIKAHETFICWENTVAEISRLYRALHDDFGIQTYWGDIAVKLSGFIQSEMMDVLKIDRLFQGDASPGDLFFHKKRNILCIKCVNGWIGFENVGIPDRKPMSAKDFYNGFLSPNKPGEKKFFSFVKKLNVL